MSNQSIFRTFNNPNSGSWIISITPRSPVPRFFSGKYYIHHLWLGGKATDENVLFGFSQKLKLKQKKKTFPPKDSSWTSMAPPKIAQDL